MVDFDRIWEQVKDKPEVNGINEELTDEGKVQVTVSRMTPEAESEIPESVDGGDGERYEVEIVEIGEIRPFKKKTERFRPLKAGISIAHEDVTAGTLGWYCRRDDQLLILSNNHVLADENRGDKGDPVLQPGPHDGGQKPEDVCGKLFDYVPIRFSHYSCPWRRFFSKVGRFVLREKAEPNLVDLALCKPSADVEKEIFTEEGEEPLIVKGKRDPERGETVKKSGRTTCLTEDGEVKMTKWRGMVRYSRGMAEFKDQILVKAKGFSAGGDSGSAVLDEENNFVGLLFAGSKTSTIVNKMSNVEKVGNVEVITVEAS